MGILLRGLISPQISLEGFKLIREFTLEIDQIVVSNLPQNGNHKALVHQMQLLQLGEGVCEEGLPLGFWIAIELAETIETVGGLQESLKRPHRQGVQLRLLAGRRNGSNPVIEPLRLG